MMQEDLQHLFPAVVTVEVATTADEDESLLHPAELALTSTMIPAQVIGFVSEAMRNIESLRMGFLLSRSW